MAHPIAANGTITLQSALAVTLGTALPVSFGADGGGRRQPVIFLDSSKDIS